MSCQPGAPIVTVLGQVSGFEIYETVQTLKNKTSKNAFYISGKCNASVSEIEVSFDSGATYTPLNLYAETYSNDCAASGTFSYKINPNSTIAFDLPANSSFKDFKIRGNGDYGLTAILNLRRAVASDFQVTTGSTKVTGTISGTPVFLRARLLSSVGTTTGGTYKFKGAIRIK